MDFLLNRMVGDVAEFYDLNYLGGDTALLLHRLVIERAKGLHIAILKRLYDPQRFQEATDLEAERRVFLTEVQQAVDLIRGAA